MNEWRRGGGGLGGIGATAMGRLIRSWSLVVWRIVRAREERGVEGV